MGFKNSIAGGQKQRDSLDTDCTRRSVRGVRISIALVAGATVFLTAAAGCSPTRSDASSANAVSASGSRVKIDLPPVSNLNTAADFFGTAEKTASLLDKPSDKVAVLSAIARQRQKAGDIAGAKQTLAQVTQIASTITATDTTTTQYILPVVAETQAALGDLPGAYKTAQRIKDDVGQSDAWYRIIAGQAEGGDLNGAIATIGKAKFTVAAHQYAALGAIATEAAASGDARGANFVAHNVEAHWRPKVYIDVADALYRRGNTSAAQQMLQTALNSVDGIRDPKNPSYENANRADALMSIAQMQIGWNDKSGARKTLQRAYQSAGKVGVDSNASWRLHNDVIGRLVSNLLLVGDTTTARAASSSIKDSPLRDAYIRSVSTGKPIFTPDLEDAVTNSVEFPIVAQVRQGKLAEAKQDLENVHDVAHRALLLADVGFALQSSKGNRTP